MAINDYSTNGSSGLNSVWDAVGPIGQAGAAATGALLGTAAQAGGYNTAAGTAQTGINTSAGYLSPYATGGVPAMGQLENLYGLNPSGTPNYSGFANTPGYQFQLDQGDQAISRGAAAAGGGFSSTTLGALDKYNTGLADSTYQNYVSNLYNLTGIGSGAAGQAGAQALTGAAQLEGAQVGAGTATGSGIAGAAGAIVGGIGKLFGSGGTNNGNNVTAVDPNTGQTYNPNASNLDTSAQEGYYDQWGNYVAGPPS
jgi:hypothetical protein